MQDELARLRHEAERAEREGHDTAVIRKAIESILSKLRSRLRKAGYTTRANRDGTYTICGLWPERHTEFALWRLWEGLSKCK